MFHKIFTLGVYGKTEEQFFASLIQAGIHTFCDIRMRRGVRGSQYAFVNSTYLQRALSDRNIFYRYLPELAPTKEMREAQHRLDVQQGVLKRNREELGAEFKRRYTEAILSRFDTLKFAQNFEPNTDSIVLFCVEGNPAACHRSLLAERVSKTLQIPVEHL
jgi:hypothetical protein